MKIYRVAVEMDEGWFFLQAVNDPGVYTQAKSLDEAIFMIRDVVALLYDENDVQVELVVPPDVETPFERRWKAAEARKKARRGAAKRIGKTAKNRSRKPQYA